MSCGNTTETVTILNVYKYVVKILTAIQIFPFSNKKEKHCEINFCGNH